MPKISNNQKNSTEIADVKNRFDLEQEILGCWNITSELELLHKNVLDGVISNEELSHILLGLKLLYNIKFDNTFKTFEQCIRNGKL